jgi:hypothetical protein
MHDNVVTPVGVDGRPGDGTVDSHGRSGVAVGGDCDFLDIEVVFSGHPLGTTS